MFLKVKSDTHVGFAFDEILKEFYTENGINQLDWEVKGVQKANDDFQQQIPVVKKLKKKKQKLDGKYEHVPPWPNVFFVRKVKDKQLCITWAT